MSQHDYNVANGTGASVRSDINLALTAIATANSGASSPTTTYAFQLWADTTSGNLKIRNGGNSAWIEVGALASDEELNKLDGCTATTTELNLLAGATQLGVIMTSIYPVGHVYTTVASGNPNTLLAGMSGTTWVSFGSGKTLVGLDSADADFNSIEETGGVKTNTTSTGNHTLTLAQIPSHNHSNGSFQYLLKSDSNGTVANVDSSAGEPNVTTQGAIQSAGGGQAHSHTNSIDVVQPYIVVYFWKRTA